MRILFNGGHQYLAEKCVEHPDKFGLLHSMTGGIRAHNENIYHALDNGCFKRQPDPDEFVRYVEFYPGAAWVVLPDVVADAAATYDLSRRWRDDLEARGLNRDWSYVLQDGFDVSHVPDGITHVFLGGSTDYKMSREAYDALVWAKSKGMYVHVGRVNSPPRMRYFQMVTDSIDGTGFTKFHWRTYYKRFIYQHERQLSLLPMKLEELED